MATTFTLSSSSYDGRYLKLTCTQVKDIANNRSTINWTLEALGGNSGYYYTGPTTVKINGTQVYYKERTGEHNFPAAKGSTSGTLVVNHSVDGSKTISCSLATAIYTKTVSTVSNNWTLDTLPRAAKLESVSDFNDEGNPTITYTNYVGNSATSLYAYIYASDDSTVLVQGKSLSKTGTTYTYSLTNAERTVLRRAAANKKSLTLHFYIATTTGGTTYWSNKVVKTMSIVNANPTATFTVEDVNTATLALTGDENKFIKGYSAATYSITATAKKEATISSYSVTNGNNTVSGASGRINPVESGTFNYTVTDSRGNKVESSIKKTLINYITPTIRQEVRLELVGETEVKAHFKLTGNYFNGSFGAVNNSLRVYLKAKKDSNAYSGFVDITETYEITPTFNGNTYTVEFTVKNLQYTSTYGFICRVEDKLDNATAAEYIAKYIPVFDWSKEDFNFNVPVYFQGEEMVDMIISQGNSGDWTYRLYKSGIAECWARVNISADVNNAWGGMYTSGILTETDIDYPFQFIDTPTLNVTLSTLYGGAILMIPGGAGTHIANNTHTGAFEIARGTAATGNSFIFNYHALGRWK